MGYYSNNTCEGSLYCDYGYDNDLERYAYCWDDEAPMAVLQRSLLGIVTFMQQFPAHVFDGEHPQEEDYSVCTEQ